MNRCAVCGKGSDQFQVHYCSLYGGYLCSKHKNQFRRHGRITDFDSPKKCEFCGSEKNVQWLGKAEKYLCSKHRSQFNRLGYLIDGKTKRDPNEYLIFDNYAKICLTNKDGEITSYALIDKEDIPKCKEYRWSNKGHSSGKSDYVCSYSHGHKTLLHQLIMGTKMEKLLTT